MKLNIAIEHICKMPLNFYKGSKSMIALLEESGIEKNQDYLTVYNICNYLASNHELIAYWLKWSENKRSESGWYFRKNGQRFLLGFFPGGPTTEFNDGNAGCAEFIVKEVLDLISLGKGTKPTSKQV